MIFKSIWIENIFLDADADADAEADSDDSELFSDEVPILIPITFEVAQSDSE